MRERCLKEGFENFSAHELFEMLLSYSKPRVDTNPCAHELIDRFGSCKSIMEAQIEELCEVNGVGEHSAVLIKLVTELMRRYARDCVEEPRQFDTIGKVLDYLYSRFVGLEHERLYMMLFNNRMNLLDCVLVSEGTVNQSNVPLRRMTEKILYKKASSVILAHNHPNGLAFASTNDKEVTQLIKNTFDTMSIVLVEHLIITETSFLPIMKTCYSMFRASPYTGKVECDFYKSFYDLDENDYRITPISPPPERQTQGWVEGVKSESFDAVRK